MKTTSELAKRETYPNRLFNNNFETIVINERLDKGYLFVIVVEYIWVADLNKLCLIV